MHVAWHWSFPPGFLPGGLLRRLLRPSPSSAGKGGLGGQMRRELGVAAGCWALSPVSRRARAIVVGLYGWRFLGGWSRGLASRWILPPPALAVSLGSSLCGFHGGVPLAALGVPGSAGSSSLRLPVRFRLRAVGASAPYSMDLQVWRGYRFEAALGAPPRCRAAFAGIWRFYPVWLAILALPRGRGRRGVAVGVIPSGASGHWVGLSRGQCAETIWGVGTPLGGAGGPCPVIVLSRA